METEKTITLDSSDEALLLFGSRDQHLRLIRETLGVRLVARGDTIQIKGNEDQVGQTERVFQQLRHMLRQQNNLSGDDVRTVLDVIQHGGDRLAPQGETTARKAAGTCGHAPTARLGMSGACATTI